MLVICSQSEVGYIIFIARLEGKGMSHVLSSPSRDNHWTFIVLPCGIERVYAQAVRSAMQINDYVHQHLPVISIHLL